AGIQTLVERRIGDDHKRRLACGIVIACVPAALAGLLLEDVVQTEFRSPALVAVTLVVSGLALQAADRLASRRKEVEALTLADALVIGLAQAVALVPGVSRSGATITAALALGASRDAAARFSFLLSAPIVFGAGLLEVGEMARVGIDLPFLVGVATSALVGYLAIRYLLVYVRTRSYSVFVWYRIAVGFAVLGLLAR
ncbi:MAG TPA: undecaprenyl-diphosphate phosphatase, partial [Thermodesulfobacteriota bacterium]